MIICCFFCPPWDHQAAFRLSGYFLVSRNQYKKLPLIIWGKVKNFQDSFFFFFKLFLVGETPLFIYCWNTNYIHTYIYRCGRKFFFLLRELYDTHFATFRVRYTAPCVHINTYNIHLDYISCNVHKQIMRNKINQEEHLSVTIVTNELSYCTCCIERCIPV